MGILIALYKCMTKESSLTYENGSGLSKLWEEEAARAAGVFGTGYFRGRVQVSVLGPDVVVLSVVALRSCVAF